MRVSASCSKNHQICDIHDAHAQRWGVFSQQSRRSDHLKRDLDTNADEDTAMGTRMVRSGYTPFMTLMRTRQGRRHRLQMRTSRQTRQQYSATLGEWSGYDTETMI